MNGSADVFYESLESGVREYVLRNAGLNTDCSCHHDGYIQIQSYDPTAEQMRIYNVMHELGVKAWTAELKVDYNNQGDHGGYYYHFWTLRSEEFKKA